MLKPDFSKARWLNEPEQFHITEQHISIVTKPYTDLWQRTYYGFRRDDAAALLLETKVNFTFTLKASFEYRERFDQCGIIIYLGREDWFKASTEYETESFSRLGSVVTNGAYSDWATVDIPTTTHMWYRLHRRGPDFLVESSLDGTAFKQMRIFHLHRLGETSSEMGTLDPPAPAERSCTFGLYACSPANSSFKADFSDFTLEDCLWKAHV